MLALILAVTVALDTIAVAPDGKKSGWADLQRYLRVACFWCAPGAWGESELESAISHRGDQGYRPLAERTLLPLLVTSPTAVLPFRHDARDSVTVTLRSGQTLVALPAIARDSRPEVKDCPVIRKALAPAVLMPGKAHSTIAVFDQVFAPRDIVSVRVVVAGEPVMVTR